MIEIGQVTPLLLTRKDAATVLSMGLRKLDALVACGEIVPLRIGRSVRFEPQVLSAWVKAKQQSQPARRRALKVQVQ